MSKFFSKGTPEGSHWVTAYTRNEFNDGSLRIEPPIQTNDRFWETMGSEYEVNFHELVSNSVATIVSFSIDTYPIEYSQKKISYVVDLIVGELAQLESIDKFLEVDTQRPEEV